MTSPSKIALAVLGAGGLIAGVLALNNGTPDNVVPKSQKNSAVSPTSGTFFRNDDPTTTRSFEEYGDRDCPDFATQQEAQDFFELEGGPAKDFHNLDRDGDGVVCESLK